jgi:glycolate oxidase FAD binding subunit
MVTEEPDDEAEVSALLRRASRDGQAVLVRGGGTKLDWAPPPRRCDVLLSTRRLDALVEHEPGDLVCVVQAGMRLDALQDMLAPHGQRLMLDPGQGVAATVGGIVAAGAHGPLRTRYGAARDLVIGARFVLADGTVGHSGGKVVKNVAGYDVAKLLIGSQGTLAVITQLALRLHPVPRASRTVALPGDAWPAVESAGVVAGAAALLWPERELLVRLDGTEAGVAAQAAAVGGEPRPDAVWEEVRTAVWREPATPVAVLGVPRTRVAALLDRLDGVAERAVALPSLGLVEARLHAHTTRADVEALRTWAESVDGHLTVRRPTPELAAVAWPQRDDPALDLMRSLKRALDPDSTLAPGRFLGGM